MATAPFGPVLESALKESVQGGKLYLCKDRVVTPQFFCCMSGRDAGGNPIWDIGVAKDPVAVLIVNPTTQLIANNVNSDYSHSWSPFSTINSWSITWGDGQVSAGAWPGAGNVNHPLGGYALEGTYTITLTVTDLLGATGTDSQQVHVISADFEAFAGCGASGVWHTATGHSWQDVSTDTLDGVEIYDLKVHPFSVDLDERELWAATADGLYKSINSGDSWKPIVLPDPDGGTSYPIAASIVCSHIDALEVYVLTYRTAPTNQAWLYRTVDGGDTWTHTELSTSTVPVHEATAPCRVPFSGHQFTVWNGSLHCIGPYRREADGTWTLIPGANTGHPGGICVSGSELVQVGTNGGDKVRFWNGVAWASSDVPSGQSDVAYHSGFTVTARDSINYKTAWFAGHNWDGLGPFDSCDESGVYHPEWNPLRCMRLQPFGGLMLLGRYQTFQASWIFSYSGLTGVCGIYPNTRYWKLEWQGPDPGGEFMCMFPHSSTVYAADTTTQLLVRAGVGTWSRDPIVCADVIRCGYSHAGSIYVGAGRRIYKHTGAAYVQTCELPVGENIVEIINFNSAWFAFTVSGKVYNCSGGAGVGLTVSIYGRTHLTSMSADGQCVYVSALDSSGNPITLQVWYDLSTTNTIYEPGAGSWGGVQSDHNRGEVVWLFGDFGANVKLHRSEDWGDTLTDLTIVAWQGANEIVRPVLPSLYDSANVIAIHHDPVAPATTAYQSKDNGTTWTSRGTAPFQPQCGERDWYDPEHLLIGKIGPAPTGANHLSWSPNEGNGWHERSGGFETDAPCTSIQVVG